MYLNTKIYQYFKPCTPQNNSFWKIIITSNILILIAVHVMFYALTHCYLITSGIFLIIIVFACIYYLIMFIGKIFRRKFNRLIIQTVVFSIAIVLLLFEGVFVITGFKSTYHEKRNKYFYKSHYIPDDYSYFHLWSKNHYLQTDEYCFFRSVNSLGLSDCEPQLKKASGEFRILALGDSFTEGDGAHADSTWLRFLENLIDTLPIKVPLSYMNAGICGSDPLYEYMLLKEKLLKYHPDLVILALNSSDIFDVMLRGGIERFCTDSTVKYRKPPAIESLYAMCHISRLVFEKFKWDEFLIGDYMTSPLPEIAAEDIYSTILLFQELSNKHGFELLIVFHPFKYELENDYLGLIDVLEKTELKTGISCFNMMTYYKNVESMDKDNYDIYYWEADGHHNAKGYAAFARGIFLKLHQMGIIDSLMHYGSE